MEKLNKIEGKYYTQIAENLPIEERVFFKEGIGGNGFSKSFRIATDAEVAEWDEYKRKQEEEYQAMMGYEDSNA